MLARLSYPLGPQPVVRLEAGARVLIIGQAPGTRVYKSCTPWDDASGGRLRDWRRLDQETFMVPAGLGPQAWSRGVRVPPRRIEKGMSDGTVRLVQGAHPTVPGD